MGALAEGEELGSNLLRLAQSSLGAKGNQVLLAAEAAEAALRPCSPTPPDRAGDAVQVPQPAATCGTRAKLTEHSVTSG
jgi:hypothetical protein